jgi:ketosteroid isomerase-like protein
MSDPDVAAVLAFNDAINARDLDALGRRMHPEHRFTDSAGSAIDGKAACLEAWRGFFGDFPDYRNVFEDARGDGSGTVHVRGRSECSTPALHGPARWRAVVKDGLVAEWQVSDVTDDDVRTA